MKLNTYIVCNKTGQRNCAGPHEFKSRESVLSFMGLIARQTEHDSHVELETIDGNGLEAVWDELPVLDFDAK